MKSLTPKIWLFSSMVVFAFALQAQNNTIDSLKKVLTTQQDDTNKVNTLNELLRVYVNLSDSQNVFAYAKQAFAMAEKLHYKKGLATTHFRIGLMQDMQRKYSEAIRSMNISLKLNTEIAYKEGMAKSNFQLGRITLEQENYPEGLQYLYKALKNFEELKDKKNIALVLQSISANYSYQGDYDEAIPPALQAIKIKEEFHDTAGVATNQVGIAWNYYMLNNYTEALNRYNTGLSLYKALGKSAPNWALSMTYGNMASLYTKLGIVANASGNKSLAQTNFNQALNYNLQSLKIWQEIDNPDGLASAYIQLGTNYTQLQQLAKAKESFEKGIQLATLNESKGYMQDGYIGLSTLDSIQGNYKMAYNHYKNYIALRDTLVNQDKTKKSTQTKMQYEFEKKEIAAKAEQDKKDWVQRIIRNSILAGLVFMFLVSVIIFLQRNRISKEKKRSEDLLLNILPEEVAEELKQKGSAEAKQIDKVTVLFTDFKGFTSYSEKLTPKELVRDIDECFSAFDRIMEKYGMEKIKTIGDSYMAAGGLPVPNKTHATDAVNAALEIGKFIEEGKARKIDSGQPYFEIRIGIHTGPVVAGIVGIKKFAYDIWGDTVNIASRMESSGEAGKVNISETTYELVKDKFTCRYRGKIQAKGKGGIDMYFVEGLIAD